MNVVIGSGPAGVAAALALTDQQQQVLMIDGGCRLEADRQEALRRLRDTPGRAAWDPKILRSFREKTDAGLRGVPLKHVYGSTYHVRDVERYILQDSDAFRSLVSLAEGGLSSVWGGAMLPYSDDDMARWPLDRQALAPHYERILSEVPLSARSDALEARYPLYTTRPQPLAMSQQAEAFYADLLKNEAVLRQCGFTFGASRLAVRAVANQEGPGCVYCGMCLYGCPHGLIYNASETLHRLQQRATFQYQPGIIVDKVVETADNVEVRGRQAADRQPYVLKASRVFMAAGVLSTARILLASTEAADTELVARSSQHFILPLLRYRSVSDASREELHTLSQIFIEYADTALVRGDVHLQLYSFNDLYITALRKLLGPAYRLFARLLERQILGRLFILQGYLHSDYSPTLKIRFDSASGRIRVRAERHPDAQRRIQRVVRAFLKNSRSFRAFPLAPFVRISEPGIGVHIGGTIPVRAHPGPWETDSLGVPNGYHHVHLVDASSFPDIPPTTITLTIMANAHRIASQVARTAR